MPVQVGTSTDWVGIELGASRACGRRTNGDTYCWGNDAYGQLSGLGGTKRPYETEVVWP